MSFSTKILWFWGNLSANAVRVLALLIAFSPATGTQAQAPGTIVGQIEGGDVSVENAPAVPDETQILVGNGSVVTVHTGRAQLLLHSGGRVEICGPAKFTVLASDSALTLALNFGSVRIQVRGATPVKIYTPQIIATPVAAEPPEIAPPVWKVVMPPLVFSRNLPRCRPNPIPKQSC